MTLLVHIYKLVTLPHAVRRIGQGKTFVVSIDGDLVLLPLRFNYRIILV